MKVLINSHFDQISNYFSTIRDMTPGKEEQQVCNRAITQVQDSQDMINDLHDTLTGQIEYCEEAIEKVGYTVREKEVVIKNLESTIRHITGDNNHLKKMVEELKNPMKDTPEKKILGQTQFFLHNAHNRVKYLLGKLEKSFKQKYFAKEKTKKGCSQAWKDEEARIRTLFMKPPYDTI